MQREKKAYLKAKAKEERARERALLVEKLDVDGDDARARFWR
jgi:hypothetical protein